jgi:hypothetical protein
MIIKQGFNLKRMNTYYLNIYISKENRILIRSTL